MLDEWFKAIKSSPSKFSSKILKIIFINKYCINLNFSNDCKQTKHVVKDFYYNLSGEYIHNHIEYFIFSLSNISFIIIMINESKYTIIYAKYDFELIKSN